MKINQYALINTSGRPYETLKTLIGHENGLAFVTEDEDNYYTAVNTDDPYDRLMWAIDKKTGKSIMIDEMDYVLHIEAQTTEVEPPYERLLTGR